MKQSIKLSTLYKLLQCANTHVYNVLACCYGTSVYRPYVTAVLNKYN